MSAKASTLPNGVGGYSNGQISLALVVIAIILTVFQYWNVLPEWLHRLPEAIIPDFASWLDAIFKKTRGLGSVHSPGFRHFAGH